MKRIIEYKIKEEGDSVLSFLQKKGYSRHVIVQLKKMDRSILLDGKWVHVKEKLHAGQCLTVRYEEMESSQHIVPSKIEIPVVYEDEDLIVINKPAGMPVHPSQGNYGNTLANALAYYYKDQGEPFVYRCINRLDRDTTGLLIVAKNGISACGLSFQMKHRQIKREYQAVVMGRTPPAGRICAPIKRKEGSTLERIVDFEEGENAVTHYERLAGHGGLSLLRIHLETGRTHQIRVHMKYIGHPLPGDFLYYPDYSRISRQPLHSAGLSFLHPVTGQQLHFHAPLPEDMKLLLS